METKGSVAQRVRGRDTVGAHHVLGGVLRLFVLVFACFYVVKKSQQLFEMFSYPHFTDGKRRFEALW